MNNPLRDSARHAAKSPKLTTLVGDGGMGPGDDSGIKTIAIAGGAALTLAGLAVGGVYVARQFNGSPIPDSFPSGAAPQCQGVIADKTVKTGYLSDGTTTWRVVLDKGVQEASAGPISGATVAELCQLQVDAAKDGAAQHAAAQSQSGSAQKTAQAKERADWVSYEDAALELASQNQSSPATSVQGYKDEIAKLQSTIKSSGNNPQVEASSYLALNQVAKASDKASQLLGGTDPDQARAIIKTGELSNDPAYGVGGKHDPVLSMQGLPTTKQVQQQVNDLSGVSNQADSAVSDALPTVARSLEGPTWLADNASGSPSSDVQSRVDTELRKGTDINKIIQENEVQYRNQPGVADRHMGEIKSRDVDAVYNNEFPNPFAKSIPGSGVDQKSQDIARADWLKGDSDQQIQGDVDAHVRATGAWLYLHHGDQIVALWEALRNSGQLGSNSDGWCLGTVNRSVSGAEAHDVPILDAYDANGSYNTAAGQHLVRTDFQNMPAGAIVWWPGGTNGHIALFSGRFAANGDPIMLTTTGWDTNSWTYRSGAQEMTLSQISSELAKYGEGNAAGWAYL